MEINVKKRDGSIELFSAEKTNKVLNWACDGISGVSQDEIGLAFHLNLKNGISTKEIQNGLIDACIGLISKKNPNYEQVAANLLNYQIRKIVWGGISPPKLLNLIKKNVKKHVYSNDILKYFSEEEIENLESYIDHDRDFKFKYSGLNQVVDKYLVKNALTKELYETPQFAFMLIAMVLFKDDKKLIKQAYDSFSLFKISLPTPIIAGVRTNLKSFASCCLLDIGDDTNEICTAFEVVSKFTAKRYGIGINFGSMRSLYSPIRNGECLHTGKVAFLRILQDTIKAWLQSSTRSGAATVTVPIWDYEIEEILQLKDVMRPPDNRVGEIDYSISFSKIFYERFIKNEKITLFSSHEVPELVNSFGMPEFDNLYIEAENNNRIKVKKQVPARELFSLFNKFRIETGRLYVTNIDHVNNHGSFLDHIKMLNLCQEVGHPVKPLQSLNDENGLIGICILSALNVLNIKNDEELEFSCDLVVRMLNNLIDYQEYPCVAAENFAKKFRSIGVGITNFAALLAKKGLKYSSQEAREFTNELMEKIQFFLLKSSNKLAQESGPCEWFYKSKYSKGILPIDTYSKEVDKVVPNEFKMNWESLRKDIVKFGLKNVTLSAMMPCEASSLTTNSTNGVERPRSQFLVKTNKSKDFPVIIPNFNKWTYEYAFENYDNEDHIKMMSILQKYCDMSISTNLYYNYNLYEDKQIPAKILNKDLFLAYKLGLKSIYYTNSDDGNIHNLKDETTCVGGACSI